MARPVDQIRFNALRNALYHTARRRSFERWNRFFNFLVIALGAAAIADLLPAQDMKAYIGAAVAIVGALQLVFDFGGQARTHQVLQRDYYGILADIEEAAECTDDLCRAWEGKMVRIAGDEPPTLRALDAKAYNDAIDAMEWGDSERLVIPVLHRVFGSIFSYEGAKYNKRIEVHGPSTPPALPAE